MSKHISLKGFALKKAIDTYIIDYSLELGLQKSTIENKSQILYRFYVYLDGASLSVETCRSFLSYMYEHGWKSPNSRLDLVRVLRAFVNFLCKRSYLDKNFSTELVKPQVHRKNLDLLSQEQAEELIIAGTTPSSSDNSRNRRIKLETRLALRFILRTGLRIGELINLKGSDLALDSSTPFCYIHSKGGNVDLQPVPNDIIEELMPLRFRIRAFEVTEKTCNLALKRGALSMGINSKITNHSLRHIFCTANLKRGISLQQVSRLMRHSSVTITDSVYSHYNLTDLATIVNSQEIVRSGLSTTEVMNGLLELVKSSKIQDDSRFLTDLNMSEDRLQIAIVVI